MIKRFVDRFVNNKEEIRKCFEEKHPENYVDIVKILLPFLHNEDDEYPIDDEIVHTIDDGNYQGTLLFVIPEKAYQPHFYYYVKVFYGSCSGCDTFEGIRGYSDEKPTKEQVDDYMVLALHIIQGLKEMD